MASLALGTMANGLPRQTQPQTRHEVYDSKASRFRHVSPPERPAFCKPTLPGHTWFMSSMHDTHEQGDFQYQQFPSESSKGRLLRLNGRDTHDGSRNYYALAWPEALASNAILMKGLTFVSYSHYDYENIWHGLSALVPFVAWHRKNSCETPTRWILYHWGELRFKMGTWLNTLMEATFGRVPYIEGFKEIEGDDHPVCFQKAVVMRHNEGGMSKERRMEVYDLIRCKARMYCNVSLERKTPDIRMTLFMRTGPRSFRNDSAVIGIFEKECKKVEGCRLMVAYSNNLTVCEQVSKVSRSIDNNYFRYYIFASDMSYVIFKVFVRYM